MVHIFFVPGMFGSMLEYVLRSHTVEGVPVDADITPDGSMHSFVKRFHPLEARHLLHGLNDKLDITTPVYPTSDMHLNEIISKFREMLPTWDDDIKFLIHAPNLRWAEINMLFQYHKVAVGLNKGIGIIAGNNHDDIVQWNKNYTHWDQMRVWEFREWISLFYETWVQEWIHIDDHIIQDFIKISAQDIIDDPKKIVREVIQQSGYTPKSDLDDFLEKYIAKQIYILDEYRHIESAVKSTIENSEYEWPTLNIIGEAIIQRQLRSQGLEIACDGLDEFPTNSLKLKQLTYRPEVKLHQS